jgi:lipoate-protein ligase A
MDYVIATTPGSRPYSFSEEDIRQIQKLRNEKFVTNEWNYGQSPDYSFKKSIRTPGGVLEMNLEVKHGIIEKVKIFGDFFSERGIEGIEQALETVSHHEAAIRNALPKDDFNSYLSNITADDLIEAMF